MKYKVPQPFGYKLFLPKIFANNIQIYVGVGQQNNASKTINTLMELTCNVFFKKK